MSQKNGPNVWIEPEKPPNPYLNAGNLARGLHRAWPTLRPVLGVLALFAITLGANAHVIPAGAIFLFIVAITLFQFITRPKGKP